MNINNQKDINSTVKILVLIIPNNSYYEESWGLKENKVYATNYHISWNNPTYQVHKTILTLIDVSNLSLICYKWSWIDNKIENKTCQLDNNSNSILFLQLYDPYIILTQVNGFLNIGDQIII